MFQHKFHCLVMDTTAFINNVPVQEYADFFITVPEVVKEIKSKRQLKRLCVLPYDLKVDEPSIENVKYVIEFAKKTGDYLSLSSADIKVIALTYQLEKEFVGTDHLRTEPIATNSIASRSKPEEFLDSTPLVGFYMPCNQEIYERTLLSNASNIANTECSTHNINAIETNIKHIGLTELTDKFEKSSISPDDIIKEVLVSVNSNIEEHEEDNSEEEDEDSLNSWITPSNIFEMKSSYGKDDTEDLQVKVACMTTDYAIQNVLKQLNLNIGSLNGKIIKQMRTYILRCYACFKTTSIMTKIFCPNCGNKTLKRVAVSLDENGQQIIHINTRRPLTAKGKNTSIPRPQGGKHATNPILFEDQPIPNQMPSRVARTKTNALEEDYITGFSPFVRRDVDSKSALLRAKAGSNIKQWVKNNEYKNIKSTQKK